MRRQHNPLLPAQDDLAQVELSVLKSILEVLDWYKEMQNGRDPFGLFTEHPNLQKMEMASSQSPVGGPLSYFCSIATMEQFQHALQVIPLVLWVEIDALYPWRTPVFFGVAHNPDVNFIRMYYLTKRRMLLKQNYGSLMGIILIS